MNAGIIAEDDSDVAVISAITLELLKPPRHWVQEVCKRRLRETAAQMWGLGHELD